MTPSSRGTASEAATSVANVLLVGQWELRGEARRGEEVGVEQLQCRRVRVWVTFAGERIDLVANLRKLSIVRRDSLWLAGQNLSGQNPELGQGRTRRAGGTSPFGPKPYPPPTRIDEKGIRPS